MEASAPLELILATREDMIAEAKHVIDSARKQGLVLRLIGGLAQICAQDWGLFHDVELNLARLRERLDAYALEPGERDRVRTSMARLGEAIEAQPKSRAWRHRAKIGERRPWHETVEEQE